MTAILIHHPQMLEDLALVICGTLISRWRMRTCLTGCGNFLVQALEAHSHCQPD